MTNMLVSYCSRHTSRNHVTSFMGLLKIYSIIGSGDNYFMILIAKQVLHNLLIILKYCSLETLEQYPLQKARVISTTHFAHFHGSYSPTIFKTILCLLLFLIFCNIESSTNSDWINYMDQLIRSFRTCKCFSIIKSLENKTKNVLKNRWLLITDPSFRTTYLIADHSFDSCQVGMWPVVWIRYREFDPRKAWIGTLVAAI